MTSIHISRLLLVLAAIGLTLPPTMAVSAETETKAAAGVMRDFNRADQDRDGYLSSKEGLDYVGTSLTLDDLAFKAADTNGDGRLSPEEFASHAEAKRAETLPTPTADKPAPSSY